MNSAYQVTRQAMLDLQHRECSSSQQMASFWRCIWKLPIPNKIKAFAWRDCRNIWPIKANLQFQKVTQDNVCEECGVAVESSGHVFWHCVRAKEVWTAANMELGNDLVEINKSIDLL